MRRQGRRGRCGRRCVAGWSAALFAVGAIFGGAGGGVARAAVAQPPGSVGHAQTSIEAEARVPALAGRQEAIETALARRQEAIETTLEAALARRQEAIERARQALERARQVCVCRRGDRERGRGFVGDFGLRARPFELVGVRWILAHAEDLGLSQEQIDAIRTAWREHRRAGIERDAQIEVAEVDLEELMSRQEDAELEAIEKKMLEIAQLRVRGRIAELRLRRRLEQLLTAEQRERLREELDEGFGWFEPAGPPAGDWHLGRGGFQTPGDDEDLELIVPGGQLRPFRRFLRDHGGQDEREQDGGRQGCPEQEGEQTAGSERTSSHASGRPSAGVTG